METIDNVPTVGEFRFSSNIVSNTDSAATNALFMAVWVPLILGTLRKPGLQPIKQPPGNVSFGMAWNNICLKDEVLI